MTIKGKTWSRDTNSRSPFGVNVTLNLSIGQFFPLFLVTVPEYFAKVNSAQSPSNF